MAVHAMTLVRAPSLCTSSFLGFRIIESMAVFTGDTSWLHNHDTPNLFRTLPSTALLPLRTVLSLRLQNLADRPVCLSDPKGSATISPEEASPRGFQRLQEVVLEHLYSSRSYVS